MRRRVLLAGWLAVILVASGAGAGTFVPISQERSVSSCAGNVTTSPITPCDMLPASDRDAKSVVAPDFSDFDATVQSSFAPGPYAGAGAGSSQQSQIGATAVTGTGSVYTTAVFTGISSARSLMTVILQVPVTTPYTLSGELGADTDAWVSIDLDDPGGHIIHVQPDGSGQPYPGYGEPFSFSGVLAPGQYTLTARASSCSTELEYCGQGLGSSFFDVALVVVPEPSTGLLVAFGLAWLGGARRRARA